MKKHPTDPGIPGAWTTFYGMDRNDAVDAAQIHYGEYDENGVDLSLIRSLLRMSPLDRLVKMEQRSDDIRTLLEYGRVHRQAKADQDRRAL